MAEIININLSECAVDMVNELRLPIINRFYSANNYNVKCGRLERVYSLTVNGNLIAAARLIPQQSGSYLLRNLFVSPMLRNQGVARYLLSTIIKDLGDVNCYCYSLPHLQNFYLSLCFKHLTLEQAPVDIAQMHVRNCLRKRGWILMGYIT